MQRQSLRWNLWRQWRTWRHPRSKRWRSQSGVSHLVHTVEKKSICLSLSLSLCQILSIWGLYHGQRRWNWTVNGMEWWSESEFVAEFIVYIFVVLNFAISCKSSLHWSKLEILCLFKKSFKKTVLWLNVCLSWCIYRRVSSIRLMY